MKENDLWKFCKRVVKKEFGERKLLVLVKGNSSDNARMGVIACWAKLEINARDIFRTENHFMGEVDYYYTIKCPCCGALTDLDVKELPIDVKVSQIKDDNLMLKMIRQDLKKIVKKMKMKCKKRCNLHLFFINYVN